MKRKDESYSQESPAQSETTREKTERAEALRDLHDQRSSVQSSLPSDKRRLQRALYIVSALSVVQLVGLMLFFFFFIDSAGRSLDEKLDSRVNRFCNDLNTEMLARVGVAGDLKAEVIRLKTENERLTTDAAEARETLRRQLIVMERQKQEIKTKESLLDDSLAYLDGKASASDSVERKESVKPIESTEASKSGGQGEPAAKGEPAGPTPDKGKDAKGKDAKGKDAKGKEPAESFSEAGSDLLYDLNHFLSGYSDSAVKIIEFKRQEDSALYKPVVRAKRFLDQGSAVLMPETLTFKVEDSKVIIRAMGGIAHLQAGDTRSIPKKGMPLASLPLIGEESELSPGLCRFFGLPTDATEAGDSRAETQAKADTPFLLVQRLNELLKKERGEKYQFKSIGRVQDKQLKNVKLQQHGDVASLNHLIVADSCEIWLVEKYRYLEIRFKDGFLIQDKKSHPFYKNQYRLPIPEVDCKLWLGAGLDCLNVEKASK